MSLEFSVADALAWTQATLRQGTNTVLFQGVSTDTRTLASGMLFVAIRGEKHDAHRFLATAVERGASGLLIERGRTDLATIPSHVAILEVEDTTQALGALGAGHRARFHGPVIAITGSNGKTSTKEMCAAMLSMAAPCLKNEGNLNNQFGLPLTLLQRSREHERLVVEIGMNHVGEIAPLAAIARPTIAVITNVGSAHLGHMGSREIIAEEKGALIAALAADATAILNADDPLVMSQAPRTRARIVTFGREAKDADFRAAEIQFEPTGQFRFQLITPQGQRSVRVIGLDEICISNALAAAAAAQSAGITLEEIERGLAAYRPAHGRMEILRRRDGVTLVDDTYNANPQSMEAALRSVARHKGTQRAIAVLGDMGELGANAAAAHQALGQLAAKLDIDFLVVLGEYAAQVIEAAQAAGFSKNHARLVQNHEEAIAYVAALLRPGDWVLAKGSRSMRMERVVEALAEEKP